MVTLIDDEAARVERLVGAQDGAERLFAEVISRQIIGAGKTEREVSDAIRDIAADLLGVSRWWHKRIVRAGPNTLLPYRENPPDRTLTDDDIVFLDFGPIFEEWEADFGRTFVLGDDHAKHALADTLEPLWECGRRHFEATPDITGQQLFAHMVTAAAAAGYEFGGHIAGHLVGQFPHEKIAGDEIEHHIMPGSDRPMRRRDRTGLECHWILEATSSIARGSSGASTRSCSTSVIAGRDNGAGPRYFRWLGVLTMPAAQNRCPNFPGGMYGGRDPGWCSPPW